MPQIEIDGEVFEVTDFQAKQAENLPPIAIARVRALRGRCADCRRDAIFMSPQRGGRLHETFHDDDGGNQADFAYACSACGLNWHLTIDRGVGAGRHWSFDGQPSTV